MILREMSPKTLDISHMTFTQKTFFFHTHRQTCRINRSNRISFFFVLLDTTNRTRWSVVDTRQAKNINKLVQEYFLSLCLYWWVRINRQNYAIRKRRRNRSLTDRFVKISRVIDLTTRHRRNAFEWLAFVSYWMWWFLIEWCIEKSFTHTLSFDLHLKNMMAKEMRTMTYFQH